MRGLSLTIFCLSALILSSFVQVPFFAFDFLNGELVAYDYSLQFITCFLLALIFEKNYSSFAVMLYLVFGLVGFPIFANGGGFNYIFEPGFAYLLALMPLSILAFTYKKLNAFLFFPEFIISNGTPIAIIVAHVFAVFVLFMKGQFNGATFVSLSFYQFFYDLFFAILFASVISILAREPVSETASQSPFRY